MNTTTITNGAPRSTGDGVLVALLKAAVAVLARAENKQLPVHAAAPAVEAPVSNDVDLWKLYWAATGTGATNAKVRRALQRAAGE